jgi:hypothetical protein
MSAHAQACRKSLLTQEKETVEYVTVVPHSVEHADMLICRVLYTLFECYLTLCLPLEGEERDNFSICKEKSVHVLTHLPDPGRLETSPQCGEDLY